MASDITSIARDFFEACETGKGWESCKNYCQDGATFSCQADALADVATVEGYVEWVKGLFALMPDAGYQLRSVATDADRNRVCVSAVFHATHTGEGGPVPPTGKKAASDYVYDLEFRDGRIASMTKIWNDGVALRQLGWA
jgi:predicted ester cyclase